MVKLYVEGGGDEAASLSSACRKGFTLFLKKAGVVRKPRIVACGSRKNAYDSFCIAIENGDDAFLLIDSEAPVDLENQRGRPEEWLPWRHLKRRQGDGWDQPLGSKDTDCHLMVQCMENWFVADHPMLTAFFGQGLRLAARPTATRKVEDIEKTKAQSRWRPPLKPAKPRSHTARARIRSSCWQSSARRPSYRDHHGPSALWMS